MKKILSLMAIVLLATIGGYSQNTAPDIFNYQGVARNSVGNVLINQTIRLRITIHHGTPIGAILYQEQRVATTNPFGLFNVQVGSPGATAVVGSIQPITGSWVTPSPWGTSPVPKFIQVEIDPAGGTSFINIGTAQIASVPYALYSSLSNDLVLPYLKTQADAGTLFRINNSGTGISGAIMGVTQSPAANAWGVHGRVDNTAAGGFSAGVLGTNLSTTGFGIGVMGTQNGSGWGVYGTAPSGIGVNGASTSGIGVNGSSVSGTGGQFSSTSGLALLSAGGLRLTGIGEGAPLPPNTFKLLAGDPVGNATWQHASAIGLVSGSGTLNFVPKWTPNGTTLGNSQIFDNGTNVGISTTTPAYKLDVVHPGGSGIESRGTAGFSVVDVDASNGDAALRFLGAGAFRWNIRNDPAGNDLQVFDMTAGLARMRLLTANGNLGIATGAPAYRLDVDATSGGSSNGLRVRNTASFAVVDVVGATTDQALRFGKNGAIWSGINTLPDGDHINFFKFGVGNLMAVNVNTGNLGVGGTIINPVAKIHARGFNVANNLYSSSTGFLGATGIGSNDVTAQPGSEKWGIHTFVNGALGTQHGIFAEPGTTAAINTGLFARVSTAPAAGQSFGLFALDFVNNGTTTWAATIRGRLQYQDGTEGLNKILRSDANGNASWVTLAGGGVVGGSGTLNFIPKWTPDGNTLGNSLLFDNGTAVGLGTTTPSHRFTVSHGGATGILVSSTGTFSVIDINAANGDAALRFGNNGTNQWNTRNRPADNYYEIFELGGGGSRVVIQDGTGNVGIGATVAPTYKLDVEHGGATGIRSLSTGTFSVIDIDAANGDAALRFQKAGTGMWNTRNRPADDYYEIFELGGGGSRFVIQDGSGNVGIGATVAPAYKLDVEHGGATGIRSKSTGTFSVIDIDASNGDAALRFAAAGVNQWNTRNRPADNYYEIFELGGGGSRVVIQDGSGNVGIGETTSPSYKLDVLHGGATGIRSRSSGTFSVIDIDASNGDAALRFQSAGVNQWNTRNRPADNYYEIFELGGGGSRFVIQDGSGNVGIGATVAPSYKLDVEHGGATGIRSKSTGTFSLMDIDAANGDAALRFAKAGVNQWNIRNNPATDDLQFFELGGGGERMRIDNTTGHVWVNGAFDVLGAKNFAMDHPLDPENKILRHAAAESNEVINFYSGNVVTDASGKATVMLPDYYEALNKDSRYQLTVIGTFAQAIISKEVQNNRFEISTNQPNVKVSWEVKGVRNDARMRMFPYESEEVKSPAQKGKYLDPIVHNQPASKGVSYDASLQSSLTHIAPSDNKAAPATTGGSLDQGAIVPPVVQKVDNSGSVGNVEPAKAAVKNLDVSGSVIQTEAIKPATKKVDVSGSVSDEMQKPAIKTQEQPKTDKAIEPAKQVKEPIPAILKGSSMDPNAKPVMPAEKTPDAVIPAQNSGNTQPATEQKQVSKENNSVPSSTVPTKKD